MEIEIFKTGTWTDSNGNTRTWTEEDLDLIVSKYNTGNHEAPVVIGHPKDNDPAYGWVERLERRGQSLWAKIRPTVQEFVDWVKQGLYKKVSISLYPDLTLRHVGFLGAVPPAVKGLKPVQFAEGEHVEYEYREWTTEERKKLAEGKIKGEFAGPNNTFPIAGPDDVADAWRLAGHAEDPDTVRRNIIRIAKKYGWLSYLPETAIQWAKQHNIELKEAKMSEDIELKLKEKEEEIARLKQELEAERAKQRKAEYSSFCDELIREGRLTPAMKPLAMDFMEIMSKASEFEFSEGDDKKVKSQPIEKFKAFLKSLPKQVEFGEMATKDKVAEARDKTKDIKEMSGWELIDLYKTDPQGFKELVEKSIRR